MTNCSFEAIEEAAWQLAPAERLRLVGRLLLSLDEDDAILASWVAEAERRSDAFDRGEMEAIDFDASIARIRAKLAAKESK